MNAHIQQGSACKAILKPNAHINLKKNKIIYLIFHWSQNCLLSGRGCIMEGTYKWTNKVWRNQGLKGLCKNQTICQTVPFSIQDGSSCC